MSVPTLLPTSPTVAAPEKSAPVRGGISEWFRWDLGLFVAALALAAWAVGRQFAVEWESNPQYSYGWTVPFLGALLLVKRWRERPLPQPSVVGSPGRRVAWAVLAAAALLWAPSRLVQEANPDWRPWGWLMALEMLALAWAGLGLLGGGRWVRWFMFPLAFLLVAAPWPERMENACIQGLMHGVATVAVEFLDLLGIPAVQRGNLIEVGHGLIGVEEACSGIRSLQATLMAGLFLGEFYRLTGWLRRAALLLTGAALALATNLARTLFLVFIDVREGSEAFARWHDRAGLATLCGCLLGLWLMALWLAPRDQPAAEVSPVLPGRFLTPSLPLAAVGCLAAWMVGTELWTEGWYRWRGEMSSGPAVTWTAHPPAAAASLRSVEVPETSRALLRYTEGHAEAWLGQPSEGAGTLGVNERWTLFFARWAPGRGAAASAKMHTPRICLTAAGKTLLADLGAQPITVANGLVLPLHAYRFDAGAGRELHVFHILWEDRPAAMRQTGDVAADEPDGLGAAGRLRAAWAGRRNLGQRVLEISILGPDDPAVALARITQELPAMIQAR